MIRLLCRPAARDESEAWKAVARESLQAFDAVFARRLYGHSRREGGRIAIGHLQVGRKLMQPIIDRYVADARTPTGRAWRRWGVDRGPYVRAFEEALAYATALAGGASQTNWPMLWSRDGRLHLIQRHTGDRRILQSTEGEQE